jgi:peptidoglycan/LPS O-acetylase OafA/YrhL
MVATIRTVATRLAWLDALRGVAALVVALHHAVGYYTPGLRRAMGERIDLGTVGVLVFFLVSGYIVPASLERRGDVRAFWIGRFFRIYPLVAVACAIGILPVVLGLRELRAGLGSYDPVLALVAHLTMLQDLLGVPNAMNVLWTLSYEMAFYLLVVAVFVVGAPRRGDLVALVPLALGMLAGGVLPIALLTRTLGVSAVVVGFACALVVVLAAAMSGSPGWRLAGGLGGGVLALVLVAFNSRIGPWEGLVILAVMFTGTVLYRAEHGQLPPRAAALVAATVLTGAIAAGLIHAPGHVSWPASVATSAVVFASGWLLRHRDFPRWLTTLGTISFSIYLLHPLLIMASNQLLGSPRHDEPAHLAVFLVALLAISWTTHRYIEAPAQLLGRRVIRSTREATSPRRHLRWRPPRP